MPFLDETTSKRIGLDRILQRLSPLSPYGKLQKEKMRPFLPGCESQVQAEWNLLASLLAAWAGQPDKFQKLELILHTLRDIRGVVKKACQDFILEDVELFSLKRFLDLSEKVYSEMEALRIFPARLSIPRFQSLKAGLAIGGSDKSFYLDDRYAPNLAALRREQRQLKRELSQRRQELQEIIARETGRTFNYLGHMRISKLEDELVNNLTRRSDLMVAAETYTEVDFALRDSEAMLALGKRIDEYEERIEAEERAIRADLSRQVARQSRPLLAACRRLGRLDLLLAKARLAKEIGWCVPEIVAGARVELTDFVNPVISEFLASKALFFQPLSLTLGDTLVTVITGANMGGKSVSLKSTGLAVAMAQLGLLVPAKTFHFSLRGFIYYSQQDENLGQGLSTFGREIQSLARVLPRRDERGLFLLDEPARGTNPWEGSALVKAFVAWLGTGNSLTLIATHFSGLSDMDGVRHLQVAGLAGLDSDQLKHLGGDGLTGLQRIMDYSLVSGRGAVPRDALKVAAFLGLAPEILARASQELEAVKNEITT